MEKNSFRFSSLYGGSEDTNNSDITTFSNYIKILLQFRTDIKMFHWQTKSFAYHKISDELLSSIDDLTDKLVENISGLLNQRPSLSAQITITDISDKNILISKAKSVITSLKESNSLFRSNSEISNIRDELLESINKALYLLSFD